MRLIPGKTKVRMELFKGVRLADMAIGAVQLLLLVFIMTSSIPGKKIFAGGIVLLTVVLLVRIDGVPNYQYLLQVIRHFSYRREYIRNATDEDLVGKEKYVNLDEAFDKVFRDGENAEQKGKGKKKSAPAEGKLTKVQEKEREARKKQEEKERERKKKEEDKILKDPKASEEEKAAIRAERAKRSAEAAQKIAAAKDMTTKRYAMQDLVAFTAIENNLINYDNKYYGLAIELPPVEFRFFSENRRYNSIENAVGRVIRAIPQEYAANIVKIDRPVIYDSHILNEKKKLEELKKSYEAGFLNEDELQARMEVLYSRIEELEHFRKDNLVIQPYYYLVLFDSDMRQLEIMGDNAMQLLLGGEMHPHRLDSKELAVFLKYSNQIDFDEREVDSLNPVDYAEWAMPRKVDFKGRTAEVNNIITHNLRVVNYPGFVGDAWMAGLMSIPNTKVVMKLTQMDKTKSMRGIDRSLQELRERYSATGVDSKRMELEAHIESLSALLAMLQGENECLLECNIYVTCYDIAQTRATHSLLQPPVSARGKITNMKKVVRRAYQESGFRLNNMEFSQLEAFVGGQISGYDPMIGQGRGIPSNTAAAAYPWIFAHIADKNGVKLGSSDGVPVFVDFFRRDSERVNSNMVVIGKSGSGKSYATKSILTNLAADDSKIFILDPENEYADLARNLHGKFINVGNAQYGRLNPFHIITALEDDEEDSGDGNSYSTHLQFLEEFFRQILPDCDKDALEYLNSLVDRTYTNKGISAETNLAKLKPGDYPIFDDLYDTILEEFQSTDNTYIRTMLRTLMNYISKFSTGGRNATIWNGPSSVTTEENFTVFNFQSLLANRNGSVANAQMLLVLKYIDNEIIKNRDYNIKNGLNRKVVVVIDEAHVFIDTKFPVALDFMFQLAKRIRKYNGMQIVITQNIKDFVGSEEIARKSTAIINACQYSFIFSLSPNDMDDLCLLYEKAGGINENEQEQIIAAGRGQAFTIMSAQSRSSFRIDVPENVHSIFSSKEYVSERFGGEAGAVRWEDEVAASRERRNALLEERAKNSAGEDTGVKKIGGISFEEITPEEYEAQQDEDLAELRKSRQRRELFVGPTSAARESASSLGQIGSLNFDFGLDQSPSDDRYTTKSGAASSAATAASSVPQVVVQAPTNNPELERLVSQLGQMVENMGRFSYDAMITEMQRMISASPTTAGAAASGYDVSGSAYDTDDVSDDTEDTEEDDWDLDALFGSDDEDDEDESSGTALGSIFNADALAEAARLDAAGDDLDDDDSLYDLFSEDEGDASFDIMAMLSEEAERVNEVSPIDMMLTYDEDVVEITLEELISYNRKNR